MVNYFIDEKKITKKEFDFERKKMNDEFGCEAIATYTDNTTGKTLARVIHKSFLKKSGVRGV